MKTTYILALLACLSFTAAAQKQHTLYFENGKKAIEGKWTYVIPMKPGLTDLMNIIRSLEKYGAHDLSDDRVRDKFQEMTFSLLFEGTITFWYPDGQLWQKLTFNHGVMNGPFESYYPSGGIFCKGTYLNGMTNGEWNYNYSNGKPKQQTHTIAYTQEELDKTIRSKKFRSERSVNTPHWPEDKRVDAIVKEIIHIFGTYIEQLPRNATWSGQQLFWERSGERAAMLNYSNWSRDGQWIMYEEGTKLAEAVFHKDSLIALYDRNGTNVLFKEGFTYEDLRALFSRTPRQSPPPIHEMTLSAGDPNGIDPMSASGAVVESAPPAVYTYVEQMPVFPGDVAAYIKKNLKYPQAERELGLEERIVVRFVVQADGSIDQVEAVRGERPAFRAEAVRMVKAMPKWVPGRSKGMAVAVSYTLPISFKLQ